MKKDEELLSLMGGSISAVSLQRVMELRDVCCVVVCLDNDTLSFSVAGFDLRDGTKTGRHKAENGL